MQSDYREEEIVAQWMRHLADGAASGKIPDADLVWLQSQFGRKRRARNRSRLVFEVLGYAMISGCAALFALVWPRMQAFVIGAWNQSGVAVQLPARTVSLWSLELVCLLAALIMAGLVRFFRPLLVGD